MDSSKKAKSMDKEHTNTTMEMSTLVRALLSAVLVVYSHIWGLNSSALEILRIGRGDKFSWFDSASWLLLFYVSVCFAVGDWAKGRKHGRGTYVYEDGSSLEGKWKEGSLMAGTWTLPSGVRFLGDFK